MNSGNRHRMLHRPGLAWFFLCILHFSVSQTDSVLLSGGGSQDAIEASRATHRTRCQLSLTSSPVYFSSHTPLSTSCSDHWLQCDQQHRQFHAVEFSPVVPRDTLLHHMFLVTQREKSFQTVSQPCSSLPHDGDFLFGFFETTAAASVRLPPHIGLLIGLGSRFVSTGLHLHYMDRPSYDPCRSLFVGKSNLTSPLSAMTLAGKEEPSPSHDPCRSLPLEESGLRLQLTSKLRPHNMDWIISGGLEFSIPAQRQGHRIRIETAVQLVAPARAFLYALHAHQTGAKRSPPI